MTRGFSLLELVVALALAGVALLLARSVLAVVNTGAERTIAEVRDADLEANRFFWIARAFGGMDTRLRGEDHRRGSLDVDIVVFTGRVRTARGLEVRDIRMELNSSTQLIAVCRDTLGVDTADTLILADTLSGFNAEYLSNLGAASQWLPGWASDVGAPVAVRLRLLRWRGVEDTLLFRTGGGG